MKSIIRAIFIAIAMLLSSNAWATQPVTIIVGYSPGSTSDNIARTLQKILVNDYKIDTVVDYRVGAGGDLAVGYVANFKQPKTVLVLTSNNLAYKNATHHTQYSLNDDLLPVAYLGQSPMILVANQHLNVNSIEQLKKIPRSILYASSGPGSTSHIQGALLSTDFRKPAIHVPYKGAAAMLPDLISGRIDVAYNFGSTIRPQIDSGQLVPLAVAGNERLYDFPAVPTLNELGLSKQWVKNWYVLMANSTADKDTIWAIQTAIKKIAEDTAKRNEFTKNTSVYMDPNHVLLVTDFVNEQIKIYQNLINDLKISN